MFANTPDPPYYAVIFTSRKTRDDGYAEHRVAQQRGRSDWYAAYVTRVCKVERAYDFSA